MEDLLLASDQYGKNGSPGWIREDIDNNGTVQVFDFVLLSNHYTSLVVGIIFYFLQDKERSNDLINL